MFSTLALVLPLVTASPLDIGSIIGSGIGLACGGPGQATCPTSSTDLCLAAVSLPCDEAEDLNVDSWESNNIDHIVSCHVETIINGASNGPHAFVASEANATTADEFDCSDFSHPEKCTLGSLVPTDGQSCGFFDSVGAFPQDGFVVEAFERIYFTLLNMFNAVQQAHDELVSEGFVDSMCKNIGREQLPIPRSVLFKLVDLSLIFIPSPASLEAAADVAAAKSVIKAFKKVSKKLEKGGANDAEAQEQAQSQQPTVLKASLDAMLSNFQQALQDQLTEIFVTAHSVDEGFYSDLLSGGVHLNPTISQDSYKASIKQNMQSYLIAQFMANTGAIFVQDTIVESCDPGDNVNDGTHCRRFGYAEPNTPATAATIDHAQSAGSFSSYGLKLSDIADNAVACAQKGGSFNDVDFDAFLESDSATFPDCLFGVPVDGI